MMMQFHSCRTAAPDPVVMPQQHEESWKAQSKRVREKLLQDSLTMFLDLGLTPREMSRVSGFPMVVIEGGLKRIKGDR